MAQNKNLFFLAIMPPENIQKDVEKIKLYFQNEYNAEHALNAPAHITLIPPFPWFETNESLLQISLDDFCLNEVPFKVTLNGFGSFRPRVIYIDIKKNKFLINLFERFKKYLDDQWKISEIIRGTIRFNPHMTVAFRDLTKENYYKAWSEFRFKKFNSEFMVDKIAILKHNKHFWEIDYFSLFKK